MHQTLFVGGLNTLTRAKDLAELFERYGPLERCEVIPARNPNRNSHPYAFVEFCSNIHAAEALRRLNHTFCDGNLLKISWALNPPSSKPSYQHVPGPTHPEYRGDRSRSPTRRGSHGPIGERDKDYTRRPTSRSHDNYRDRRDRHDNESDHHWRESRDFEAPRAGSSRYRSSETRHDEPYHQNDYERPGRRENSEPQYASSAPPERERSSRSSRFEKQTIHRHYEKSSWDRPSNEEPPAHRSTPRIPSPTHSPEQRRAWSPDLNITSRNTPPPEPLSRDRSHSRAHTPATPGRQTPVTDYAQTPPGMPPAEDFARTPPGRPPREEEDRDFAMNDEKYVSSETVDVVDDTLQNTS